MLEALITTILCIIFFKLGDHWGQVKGFLLVKEIMKSEENYESFKDFWSKNINKLKQ